ncbi:MAG: acyl-CoA dehydrogenase family protein [Actinomycetota bacterium]
MASPFELPAASRDLLMRARDTAERELRSIAEAGKPGEVNRKLLGALADHDFLPRLFPTALGGSHEGDASALDLCVLREGFAQRCTQAETALALQGLGAYPIVQSGSKELAGRWIPEVARGRAVAAFALTEPGAGSDAAALSLRAEPDGDGWRLTGEKKWISNAPAADVYSVFARSSDEAGPAGVTAFAVAGESSGLGGESLELVAPHPIGTVTFDGVYAGSETVLGEVGEGFKVAMRTLDLFRPSVGAFAVGMAQAALDSALDHAAGREAFGRELREFQAISQQLADMATSTEAARLLVYSAAARYDSGERVTKHSAMAKLFATEAAQRVIDAAIQIHGARALERGHLLEELYREVRATRIYEGTSEIQREIITRELYR